MEEFHRAVAEFQHGSAICHAAATNGVFPPILASRYLHDAYERPGLNSVRDDVSTLPGLLGDAGYATGAFLASNPYLGKWADDFDAFWNDGMRSGAESENRARYTRAHQLWNLTQLEPRVTTPAVTERATEWFAGAERPRFMWLHLMDLHGPYYPGLRRGVSVGLLQSYWSIVQHSRHGTAASDRVLETIRRLYWQCVDRLDRQLTRLLQHLPEDATVIVMADHGEELYHGHIGHARLYDECVRVPFYAKNLEPTVEGSAIRQLDLAPTIAERIGLDSPDGWTGEAHDGTHRDSFMINHSFSEGQERVYTGLRTADAKLIQTHDDTGTVIDTECYDLSADPIERNPISPGASRRKQLAQQLSEFLKRNRVVESHVSSRTDVTDSVEQRLEELGYR